MSFVGPNFADRALARAEAVAAARQRARIETIAGEFDGIAGVGVSIERDAVVVAGRGLATRWLSDARLRFAMGPGR